MRKITTSGRITILLGKQQAATGERLSPRRLAERAGVPKDLVYRLDAGQARHIDLEALARLCDALHCDLQDIWFGSQIMANPFDILPRQSVQLAQRSGPDYLQRHYIAILLRCMPWQSSTALA
jgi:DNA-binding Xre family transcriptional regulator